MYLPPGYNANKRLPMWFQLHGNYWATMDDINKKVGYNPQATDVIPYWDVLVGRPAASQAILVYPQSSGDPLKKQFWNTIFWQCSVGTCVDKTVDDVGFLDMVISTLPARFKAPPKVFLSGTSAGGMMIYTFLCKTRVAQTKVAAIVAIIGGMSNEFMRQCNSPAIIPMMQVSGMKDQNLPYFNSVIFDSVPFASAESVAKFWVGKRGFKWGNASIRKTDDFRCYDFPPGSWTRPGPRDYTLCQVLNYGHTTDTAPYKPGMIFDAAWAFLRRYREGGPGQVSG